MSTDVAGAGERPFVLVVGVDLEDQGSSGFALDEALRMTSRIAGSQMHVAYVVAPETSVEASRQAAGLLRHYVSEKAEHLGVRGPQGAGIHVRQGDAAKEIAQLASDVGADVVVVGTHGPPPHRSLFVGSTAERVMATATCPVFVAGPRPHPQPSHVIVIEPPCADCWEQRVATQGRTWWCARHSEPHHLRRHHVYSYHSDWPFRDHDSEVTATGTD